ncbi:hypothetical protein ACNQFZ_00210 [Schinkia sp. CFF1]
MRKICSILMSVGLIFTVFTNVSYAKVKDVETDSVEYGKKNSVADSKEYFLSSETLSGEVGIQAGTLVSIETNAYLWEGTVASYGTNVCSQPCSHLKVANYLHKNDEIIDWNTDEQFNKVSAIAVSDGGKYQTSNTYYSDSDHYVMDMYGQIIIDRTIDDDL